MADTAYDGSFGIPISFTFTPTTGTPFGTAQAQAQQMDPPANTLDVARFTPISGANSGNEQVVPGKTPAQSCRFTATYSSSEHAAALTCRYGKVKGTLLVTYGLGPGETVASTESWTALLVDVKPGPVNADGLRTDELEFLVTLPSVFVAGH